MTIVNTLSDFKICNSLIFAAALLRNTNVKQQRSFHIPGES